MKKWKLPGTLKLVGLLLIPCLLPGCKKTTVSSSRSASPTPVSAPKAAAVHGGSAASGLSGTVIETLESGGYTYVKLDTSSGQSWAAVRKTKLSKGQKVNISGAMLMKNFKSRTLDRVFPAIYFGSLGAGDKPIHPHGKGGKAVKDVSKAHARLGSKMVKLDQPVTRAQGATGRTVAEIFAQKQTLKDKPVAVRGKVVKLNQGILGRNWIHLQDGSGSQGAADFDLTVTSKDLAKIGDVVLVKGVLRLNKDFGSGYVYAVLLEDASVTK